MTSPHLSSALAVLTCLEQAVVPRRDSVGVVRVGSLLRLIHTLPGEQGDELRAALAEPGGDPRRAPENLRRAAAHLRDLPAAWDFVHAGWRDVAKDAGLDPVNDAEAIYARMSEALDSAEGWRLAELIQ